MRRLCGRRGGVSSSSISVAPNFPSFGATSCPSQEAPQPWGNLDSHLHCVIRQPLEPPSSLEEHAWRSRKKSNRKQSLLLGREGT